MTQCLVCNNTAHVRAWTTKIEAHETSIRRRLAIIFLKLFVAQLANVVQEDNKFSALFLVQCSVGWVPMFKHLMYF